MDTSNMTHSECFRINGTLYTDRIESLLDAQEQSIDRDVSAWKPTLQEARFCFIGEDFLQTRIDELQTLAKLLRGSNRQILLNIIACVQEDVLSAVQSSEYGADEISKILKVCK